MNYIQYVFAEREADIDIRTYDARTFWQIIWPYIDTFPKFLKEDREKFDFYNCKFYVAFRKEDVGAPRPVAVCAVTSNFKHPNPSQASEGVTKSRTGPVRGPLGVLGRSSKSAAWLWIAASTRGSKHHVRGAFPKLLAHVLNTYGVLNGRYLDKNAKRFWHHIAERDGYKLTNVMWPWGARAASAAPEASRSELAEGMILKR